LLNYRVPTSKAKGIIKRRGKKKRKERMGKKQKKRDYRPN